MSTLGPFAAAPPRDAGGAGVRGEVARPGRVWIWEVLQGIQSTN